MLRELHIQNLAVIREAVVELTAGLNVFTGQTGAGKSLVIGAFEALLGLRKGAGLLRAGAKEGRVAGLFEVRDAGVAASLSAALDQELAMGDELLITRKLFASGRTGLTVNGQPATAGMVKLAAAHLVDIHGQHDHQYLLKPSHQLAILDGFAGAEPKRARFGELYSRLRGRADQREALRASQTLRREQLELYRFQAREIDEAEPMAGELPELVARERLLRGVAGLKHEAGAVYDAMYETDGSVNERLEAITQVLLRLAETDAGLTAIAEQVRGATLTLQESAYDLGRYLGRLDLDPAELGEVESRLNVLNRLVQKYGDGTPGDDAIASVLSRRETLGVEIDRLQAEDADLSGIDREIEALSAELWAVGGELSKARAKAGAKLIPKVEAELKALGMPEARLELSMESAPADGSGLPIDGVAGPSGLDRVELLVQTNPGQGYRPLRQIASGGELSRVMLALKGVLAGSDRISVLVFDEVDANIGGRLGDVIGRKLRGLAWNGGTDEPEDGHQVLCITHLPQIAAFADRHFRIEKGVSGTGKKKQTETTVTRLGEKQRVSELAEMMAGAEASPTSRKQARELLAAAA
ncbi:MAG: DNA repair protein RecN [Planctomycetota bacterium]